MILFFSFSINQSIFEHIKDLNNFFPREAAFVSIVLLPGRAQESGVEKRACTRTPG